MKNKLIRVSISIILYLLYFIFAIITVLKDSLLFALITMIFCILGATMSAATMIYFEDH